jgi:hypothetical protein
VVSFAAITLYVSCQRVFIAVSVYFVIDSVRKLLDTPSYPWWAASTAYTAVILVTVLPVKWNKRDCVSHD